MLTGDYTRSSFAARAQASERRERRESSAEGASRLRRPAHSDTSSSPRRVQANQRQARSSSARSSSRRSDTTGRPPTVSLRAVRPATSACLRGGESRSAASAVTARPSRIEVAARIPSRRKQLYRAAASRSQLVLGDLHGLAREQAERDLDLDLRSSGEPGLEGLEKRAFGRVLHAARIERGCRRVKTLTRDCERGYRIDER